MNRPYLVNFSAIANEEQISIRASISDSDTPISSKEIKDYVNSPIKSVGLFSKDVYRIKIIGLNQNDHQIYNREFESDNHGKFELKIPVKIESSNISKLMVYETSSLRGVDIHLGSFLPLVIKPPKKLIISDFDKTLVDTKYSTPKEMYYSLNKPLSYFPTVDSSLNKINEYIKQGFQPFILSASPHFYESAIRDWLYQNQIYSGNLFLKDYRDFISIFDGALSTKDLKKQGFYKLNQLVDIMLMTGVPDHLVLMGDGFESDPFIYLLLDSLLGKKDDPWKLWKSIKNHNVFNLTSKQDSVFITKFYQLSELAKKSSEVKIEIYIRATESNIESLKVKQFDNYFIKNNASQIQYYLG